MLSPVVAIKGGGHKGTAQLEAVSPSPHTENNSNNQQLSVKCRISALSGIHFISESPSTKLNKIFKRLWLRKREPAQHTILDYCDNIMPPLEVCPWFNNIQTLKWFIKMALIFYKLNQYFANILIDQIIPATSELVCPRLFHWLNCSNFSMKYQPK